jgi:tRNA(Arg) A34 adenosine deaminase TadA
MTSWPGLELRNPDWVADFVAGRPDPDSDEARLRFVVDLARESGRQGGGPFGAAVFDRDTGRLVAPGVNQVMVLGTSLAHAEIVALVTAQRVRNTHDLRGTCDLVTSTEPCAQCYGALIWSGVRRVLIGARREDAEAIGFDEGPKPDDWIGELTRRGIAVVRDLLRDEARAVLNAYARAGGALYGPDREGGDP